MQLKDYYKILEIPAAATHSEIKKAYRRLAQVYHPDKNGGSLAAETYFKELREAYETLSNPVSREKYNFLRWQLRATAGKYQIPVYSPETILAECTRLKEYMNGIDIFRMNEEALFQQFTETLSDKNLSLLVENNNTAINRQIISECLAACRPLHPKYLQLVCKHLMALPEDDPETARSIQKYLLEIGRLQWWRQYKMALMLILTLLICLLIYFMSK